MDNHNTAAFQGKSFRAKAKKKLYIVLPIMIHVIAILIKMFIILVNVMNFATTYYQKKTNTDLYCNVTNTMDIIQGTLCKYAIK